MVGEVVSHYKILERLGGGAMGVVYRAEDTRLRRQVALKFLPADLTGEQEATTRFLREARAASSLDHPNICTVHEIGLCDDGRHFIVMPFYAGETLGKRIARGSLNVATALDFARQTASGLAHAREHGVVHRDVKPANLMITERGEVKIVDFGLARLKGARNLTRVGTSLGTAAYMAPEQVQGAEVDHGADLWALGVVLYEMLVGEPPFQGESEPALLYAVVHLDPKPSAEKVPTIVEPILQRCLEKDPAQRYTKAEDLIADLDDALRVITPAPAIAGSTAHPTSSRSSRRSLWLAAVLCIIVLAILPSVRTSLLGLFPFGDDPPRGIAVLPFDVIGGGAEERAFADGLCWMLANRLADLERYDDSFWVVPQRLVAAHDVRDGDEARLRLGVDHTLKGVLRFNGDKLSLSLQAYDALKGIPKGQEIVDGLANLETWQQHTLQVAADLLDLPLPENTLLERPGCTTVPSAFVDMMHGLGRLHPTEGKPEYELALADFRLAVSGDSSFARAYTGLGRALWAWGGEEDSLTAVDAASYLRRAAALDSTQAWPLAYLGEIQSRWWDNTEAITTLEHALAINPRHGWALDRLATIHARNGNSGAAEQALIRAVKARPGCADTHLRLGFFYYSKALFDQAAEQLERVVAITPNHQSGYSYLGAVLFEMERYDDALEMFETSISLQPTYEAYSNLGSLYFYRSRFGDAIDMYRHSLVINDEDYSVWGQLAECYYWAPGLRDSSQAVYAKAIELAEPEYRRTPYDSYILSDLASYYARVGQQDQAHSLIAKLDDDENVFPEIMFIAADVYEQLGLRNEALNWLERAFASDLSLAKIEFYPGLRELRTHPRYREMVERYGD